MQVHRMEDYRICHRVGCTSGTGQYYINNRGNKKEVLAFAETYETHAGNFNPERWVEIMRECVAASGSEKLLQRIIDHVKVNCVWLKKDVEREGYALEILAGRVYRQGRAWSNFSTEGITENTAFVFDFQGEST